MLCVFMQSSKMHATHLTDQSEGNDTSPEIVS